MAIIYSLYNLIFLSLSFYHFLLVWVLCDHFTCTFNIFKARSSSSRPPALQAKRDNPSRLSSVAEIPSSPTISGPPNTVSGSLPANSSGDLHHQDHPTCTPRDHSDPKLARTTSSDTVMSHTNESSAQTPSSGRKFRKISNSIIATQRLNSNSSFGNFAKMISILHLEIFFEIFKKI